MKKERRKARKQAVGQALKIENSILQQRVRELERKNSLLKISKKAESIPSSQFTNRTAKSLKNMFGSKSFEVVNSVKHLVTYFPVHNVSLFGEISYGVFGSVNKGRIITYQANIAVKTVNPKLSTVLDMQAKAMFNLLVKGHQNFPFFNGTIDSNKLLFELVTNSDCSTTTLKYALSFKMTKFEWVEITTTLCKTVQNMDLKGILHNELHMRNMIPLSPFR